MNETNAESSAKPETNALVNTFATPASVLVAGLLIAGAMVFNNQNPAPTDARPTAGGAQQVGTPERMKPVTAADHIRGNPDAPVMIVEYSDTECPFCKRHHTTLQQIMQEYGDSGKVAWVYRHLPLDQLHPKARKEAEATECAAELGGNEVFWSYLDRLMEITPANNGLDPAELPKIAAYVGLDTAKFNECLASGRYAEKVEAQVQDALATGGNGTPWNIVVSKKSKEAISGAQPYAVFKAAIDAALK